MRAIFALPILLCLAVPALAAPDADVKPVIAQPLANAPGQTLAAVTVNYPPGGKSGAHKHPGSVFVYVLSGKVRSQVSTTGPAKVYGVGDTFFEAEGSTHMISENASDTEPASLLVVFVAPTGATLTTPVMKDMK